MQLPSFLIQILTVLGAIQLFRIAVSLFSGIRFLTYSSGNLKKHGEWAIVTGATDGIGLGYAKQLAKSGMKLVLISRSEDKLKKVQEEELKAAQTIIIAADFSANSAELYAKIEERIKDLDIGILVNNVGVSYPYAQYFDKIDNELIDQLINVNVISMTRMTKLVLPKMAAKKKGVVINVGSAAGLIPSGDPLYAVYSGTKAYVDYFSRSLNLEYAGKGLIIENHVPYFVTSKLSKIRHASVTTPNPATYARSAISKIGYSASVVPYWAHAVQHFLMVSLPLPITSMLVLRHHLDVHHRAMKKLKGQ